MLASINKRVIIFGTLIYLFFGVIAGVELIALYLLHYLSLLIFWMFVNYLLGKPESYFSSKKTNLLVFYYSVLFILCYNAISYFYTENFYIFSVDDALVYHTESEAMSNMPFFKGIEYYLERHEAEDLGLVIIMSTLYKFFASKIMLNIFYVFVAVLTGNFMFNISKHFMSLKYACLCTVCYCLSSYVIWFHSSGLKESLMILVIVAFYSSYYSLVFDNRPISIWGVIIMPLLLLLFRPVLAIFCFASIILGIILKRKLNVAQLIFLLLTVFAGIYFVEPILSSTDKFLLGGTESMLEIKEMEGMVKGSVTFTYLVNILSSMFGPFPTIMSSKIHLSFYTPGLLFKVILSTAFWFGVVWTIKNRAFRVYPMLIFILVEMISLTYILEALELRKSIPHFPLIYIIAFIFIFRFDKQKLKTIKEHLFYNKAFNIIAVVLCFLVVYWNLR